jgi:hypothetical protein
MRLERPGPDAPAAAGIARAAFLGFAPLAVAAALTFAAAASDGTGFHDVVLLPPEPLSPGRLLVALLAVLSGYAGVYFAPGLLWMRALRFALPNAVANAACAFTLSLGAVSLAWVVAQGVTSGVGGRACLYLTVAALDAAALAIGIWTAPGRPALPALPESARGAARRELAVPAIAVVLVLALGAALMPGKITIEALEGDATEVRGFAASLFERGLPRWDLETGAWGFYPTFVFVAYPVFFSLAIGGESEAAVRLPALLFLGVLMLVTFDLAARKERAGVGAGGGAAGSDAGWTAGALAPVLAAGYLAMQVGAYYAGYHPFHGDLGCSPLEEWVVTALAMAAVLLVRDGAPFLGAVCALLSVLTFPSGLMLVGLLGVAGFAASRSELRRAVVRCGLAFAALAALYAVLLVIYTTWNGSFEAMIGEWYSKYFEGRASFGRENPARILRALGWFALLCGGLPLAGFPLAAWRGDRIARWLAAAGGAWLAFFLLSPNKNVHYFLPIALIPVAIAIRSFPDAGTAAATGRRRARAFGVFSLALTASTIAAIWLCRPSPAPPYTADREFGRRTLFLADSEEEAVAFSKVIYNLLEPLWRWKPGAPWTIGHHTWVMYADRGYEVDRDYDFYVGSGPPPVQGLTEVTRVSLPGGEAAILWSPRGRAAIREWKEKSFPLRVERSSFHFEMPFEAEPEGP